MDACVNCVSSFFDRLDIYWIYEAGVKWCRPQASWVRISRNPIGKQSLEGTKTTQNDKIQEIFRIVLYSYHKNYWN